MLRTGLVTGLTSRIIKAGALLEDTLRFLEAWDASLGPQANLARIRASGALGKTRSRSEDVLLILRQRYVDPGPHVVATLRRLVGDPTAFREASYYETARSDALLGLFAEEALYEWFASGQPHLRVDDVRAWLERDRRCPSWGSQTRQRVAQGILAALRDFGILEGSAGSPCKRFASPRLSLRGFAYVALRERERGLSDRSLVASRAWRRYLLSPSDVRALFLEADRLGLLRYAEAGSVARVDWIVRSLEEVPDVAT